MHCGLILKCHPKAKYPSPFVSRVSVVTRTCTKCVYVSIHGNIRLTPSVPVRWLIVERDGVKRRIVGAWLSVLC